MFYRMKNQIQHYHWGAKDYLPDLLSLQNMDKEPCAELWMGAHPKASSRVFIDGVWIELYHLMQDRNIDFPFLLKILSIESPLSIQVHPNIPQAQNGFDKEDKAGIPINSPQRNYRDKNHKPELLVALSDFWALKGFRSYPSILKNFVFAPMGMKEYIQDLDLSGFYHWIMHLNGKEKQLLLDSFMKNSTESDETYWVRELSRFYPGDISILSPLYLNLVHLKTGDAIYQRDGELHAYLKGNAIELMANSDNVLRGGLTSKHMDLQELQSVVSFRPTEIRLLRKNMHFFPSEVKDFKLGEWADFSRATLDISNGPAILLNMGCSVDIHNHSAEPLRMKRGESIFIDQKVCSLKIKSMDENNSHIFIATSGDMK